VSYCEKNKNQGQFVRCLDTEQTYIDNMNLIGLIFEKKFLNSPTIENF